MFHKILSLRVSPFHNYQEHLTNTPSDEQIFFIAWNPHGT